MAKITSSYINVNKLKGKAENSSSVRSASRVSVYDGTKWVDKLRMTNGSNIVWDVLATTLITPDTAIRISAAGGSLLKPAVESKNSLYYIISLDKISSYSTDVFGGVRELEHTLHNREYNKYDKVDPNLNENTIGPNNSSSERSYTITARQTITGVESNISVILDANTTNVTWGNPEINDTKGFLGVRLFNHDDQDVTYVNANGTSNVVIQVYVTQQKRFSSTSGETSNQTFSGWVDVIAISGDSYYGGAMNNQGFMIADSRGATVGGERAIYNAKQFTYLGFDGKQYIYNMYNTYAESITVYQQENSISYGGWSYSISASTSTTSYNAAAISTSATVTSKGTRSYTYTSGAKDGNNNTETKNFGWTASITSATGNSVSPTSASAGNTTAQISLGPNTSTSYVKTTTVTFKSANDTSKTATVTFTQSKDALTNPIINYTLNTPTATQVAAAGGNSTVSMTVTKKSTPLYISGNTGTATTSTLSVTLSSIGGSALNSSGATVSGTKVNVKSLANTVKQSAWNVFNITSVKGTDSDGISRNWSGSVYVVQGANTVTYGNWTYSISSSTSQTSYNAAGVSPSVTVTSTRSRTAKWTSGYDPNGNNNLQTENYGWTASISGSGNSVNPTSASAGTTRATVTLGANTNTSSAKTSVVTFKSAGDTSKTSSITFTQSKDVVASTSIGITPYSAVSTQIPASGGTATVNMTMRKTSTPLYVSGNTGTTTTTYPAATVTAIAGSAVNSSGAYVSGTGVYVKSLGTTEKTSAWNVFQISSVTGTFENKSYTYSTSFYITQGANTLSNDGNATYTFTLNESSVSVSAAKTTSKISFASYTTQKRKWTSGSAGTSVVTNRSCTASITSGSSYATLNNTSSVSDFTLSFNANAGSSSRQVVLKITDYNGTAHNVTFTQSADTVTNKLTAVTVDSVALDPDGQIGASGASVAVRVTLKKTYTKTSVANGTSYSYSYVSASSLTINGSGTATTSGDTIKVASLGATPVSTAKTVYTISSLNWSYKDENNKTWSGTHSYSKSITQQANVATSTRYGSYTLDLTSSTTTVAATGQTVQIAVTANRIKYTKYTSGAEDSGVRENINATLSTSHGSLSASSTGSFASSATVTGGKTAYFIANANTTVSNRTITVSAKLVDNTSITDSISFTQSAASFEFEVKPGSGTIPYGGGSFEFSVITTINNGGFTNAPTVTSNNTAFIIDSIVFNDILMDRYTVTVRANANTSTSARSATLTFTQAGSGQKLTATISQAGKPSSGGGGSTSNVTAEVEAYWDYSSQISYNISFNGIENYLESCKVYVTSDPYSYDRYYGEPQYYEVILPNDLLQGSITAYDFPTPSYVVVVVNNEIVGYSIAE